MRCLSIWQPWASLISVGAKRVETRTWSTPYRGPVAIHASVHVDAIMKRLTRTAPIASALADAGLTPELKALPLGAIVAVGWLDKILPTEGLRRIVGPREQAFGDFRAGRSAWFIEDIVRLPNPVKYAGAQGLRSVDPVIAAALLRLIRRPEEVHLAD